MLLSKGQRYKKVELEVSFCSFDNKVFTIFFEQPNSLNLKALDINITEAKRIDNALNQFVKKQLEIIE